jgi:hypothetical protein
MELGQGIPRLLVVRFGDLQFYDMTISVSVGRDIRDQDHG